MLKADTYWQADDVVHDMGVVMWRGKKAQRYHWVDKAGPIPLTTNDLYVVKIAFKLGLQVAVTDKVQLID